MANYNKSINFAVKDTLQPGDPQKIVSGAEIDTEFNNISSSSTTKIDKVSAATAGNIPKFTASGSIEDSGKNESTIVQIAAPAGVVIAFGGSSAPTGWLECDGSAVSRSTYAELFNNIGTNFGIGDGTSTFNLPDLRGEFVRGWDNSRGIDSGRSLGSSQLDQMQKITGGSNSALTAVSEANDLFGAFVPGNSRFIRATAASNSSVELDFDSSQSPGARAGDETRPRNVAMMYIIKA